MYSNIQTAVFIQGTFNLKLSKGKVESNLIYRYVVLSILCKINPLGQKECIKYTLRNDCSSSCLKWIKRFKFQNIVVHRKVHCAIRVTKSIYLYHLCLQLCFYNNSTFGYDLWHFNDNFSCNPSQAFVTRLDVILSQFTFFTFSFMLFLFHYVNSVSLCRLDSTETPYITRLATN